MRTKGEQLDSEETDFRKCDGETQVNNEKFSKTIRCAVRDSHNKESRPSEINWKAESIRRRSEYTKNP